MVLHLEKGKYCPLEGVTSIVCRWQIWCIFVDILKTIINTPVFLSADQCPPGEEEIWDPRCCKWMQTDASSTLWHIAKRVICVFITLTVYSVNIYCIYKRLLLCRPDAVIHARPVLAVPAGLQPAGWDRPVHEETGCWGERSFFITTRRVAPSAELWHFPGRSVSIGIGLTLIWTIDKRQLRKHLNFCSLIDACDTSDFLLDFWCFIQK